MNDTPTPEEETTPIAARLMRTQRAGIIVGVVSLIALSGGLYWGVTNQHWFASNTNTKQSAVAKNAHGYTLNAPDAWTRVDPTPEGATVAFTAPKAESDNVASFKPYIAVQSIQLNQKSLNRSVEDLATSYTTKLADSYTNYKDLNTAAATLGKDKDKAVLVKFSYLQGTATVTEESLLTVKYGILYVVSGEALTATWDSHEPEIEKALLSFRP